MNGDPFRVVDPHVARNPVARAVARKVLIDALRTFQLKVYLLAEGERADDDVWAAARSLTVTIRGMELAGRADTPEVRVMRGALSALTQCSSRGFRWHQSDAPAVDRGLTLVAELYPKLRPEYMTQAWRELRAMEQRFEQAAVA